MTNQTMLDAAWRFADRGWAVLPVLDGSKRPLLRGWPERASSDRDEIRAWWQRWPDAAVGVLAGSRSGLAILDVEAEHLAEFTRWSAQHELPETLRVTSGGGGTHYYFSRDEALPRRKVAGIGDLQGNASYVVAPPSRHASGTTYRFADGHGFDTPVAPMPEWINEREA